MNSADVLAKFLNDRARTVYPEPVSRGTDDLCKMAVDLLAKELQPGAKVLDVGCGQGYAIKRLAELGHKPTGISMDGDEVDRMRAEGFDAIVCDMHNISPASVAGAPFQGIIARHVLEHSPCPLFVLERLYDVIAPGGTLYVEVPAPDTICRHETNANHYSVFGLVMWGNLIDKAGFKVQRHSTIPVLTAAGPDAYFWFVAKRPTMEAAVTGMYD